ncbi:MAG: hypothetical protein LBM95_03180 [Lactobacillales bacterium]|jgi:hypothetical protein|nr:hypothetical protein [Lactobacillales bacterium]
MTVGSIFNDFAPTRDEVAAKEADMSIEELKTSDNWLCKNYGNGKPFFEAHRHEFKKYPQPREMWDLYKKLNNIKY